MLYGVCGALVATEKYFFLQKFARVEHKPIFAGTAGNPKCYLPLLYPTWSQYVVYATSLEKSFVEGRTGKCYMGALTNTPTLPPSPPFFLSMVGSLCKDLKKWIS